MVVVDMTGVTEPTGFAAMPAGNYRVALTSFEDAVGQKSGNPYVKLEFTLTEDESEFAKRKIWRNHSVDPKSLPFFRQTLMALGADPKDIAGQFDTDEVLPLLIGEEAIAQVSVRDYADPNDLDDDGKPIVKQQNDLKRLKALSLAQR